MFLRVWQLLVCSNSQLEKQIAVYVILHCQVLWVCMSLYTVCGERKRAKWSTIPRENLCVSEMKTWEHDCVCECVRQKQSASLLFSGAGYQAARQQGGIITEAVTFLWFLWFQHEAGGWLWLTHGHSAFSLSLSASTPAWNLLARGQYMTFLEHFNLWHINYRTMNLCIF